MIPLAEPCIGEQEIRNVNEALKSGWISSKGKFIADFEHQFAGYCGMKYGVATANGTVSLHLALVAMGIGPGHEVIVPSLTFVATANAVTYTGARVVFVDSRPDDWNLDPARIERLITPRTKAIVPVHLYGHPCDMDALIAIARKHGLLILEDAAQSHGGEHGGRKTGSFGDISSFSFYGNKTITTGEGGICLTNDEALYSRMRILRDHGADPRRRYWHDVIGYNYRMTNLQAAVGVAQIEKLDRFIAQKREIAEFYAREFQDLVDDGLMILHPSLPGARCTFWLYGILVLPRPGHPGRDDLIRGLTEREIDSRPFFHPIHTLPPYRGYAQEGDFPVANRLSTTGISLPSSLHLSEKQLGTVAGAVREILRTGK
ncbi:MAG TPA: DegT/DnrJ/EryC1/StrS aminotransferase family protein [Candidatus Polarisedimenticolia bacterium]|jgi:perosamine synthetase